MFSLHFVFTHFVFKISFYFLYVINFYLFSLLFVSVIQFPSQWTTDGFLMDKEFRNGYMDCTGLLNNLPVNSTMECIMNEMFKKFNIDNAVWQLSKNTKYYQITFFVETNICHELVLTTLNEWGIGEKNGSSMSMIPCAIYSQPTKPSSNEPIGRSRE